MQKTQHYVLFPNHDNAMRLYRELKKMGVRAVIAPTPRVLSTCCGVSLLIEEEDIERIQQCIKEHGIEVLKIEAIERDINPMRDKYC
ncbi:MAG: DUF3343 domain-containing protein [Lachnospiraceae bacterium]